MAYFDAAPDAQGRVHVSWRITGSETTYSRFDGTEWQTPVVLGGDGRQMLLVRGDSVRVLVASRGVHVHASDDGGHTWRSGTPQFEDIAIWDAAAAWAHGDRAVMVLAGYQSEVGVWATLPDGERIRIAKPWAPPSYARFPGPTDQLRLYTTTSDDGGETWTPPLPISAELGTLPTERSVSLSHVPAWGYAAAWVEVGPFESRALLSRSTDDGRSWSEPRPVLVDQNRADARGVGAGLISPPTLLPHRDGVALAYADPSGGVALAVPLPDADVDRRLPDVPRAWTRRLHRAGSGGGLRAAGATVLSDDAGAAGVLWKDTRRAPRAWYAGTPLAHVLGGANGGVWKSSDLFAARVDLADGTSGDLATPDLPLTPPRSYVRRAAAPFMHGSQICTVWQGRTDVPRDGSGPSALYLSCRPL